MPQQGPWVQPQLLGGLEACDNIHRGMSILISWKEGTGSGCCTFVFPQVLPVCLRVQRHPRWCAWIPISGIHAEPHAWWALTCRQGQHQPHWDWSSSWVWESFNRKPRLYYQEEEILWVPKSPEFSHSLSAYLKLSICPSIGTLYVENDTGIYTLLFLLLFFLLQK